MNKLGIGSGQILMLAILLDNPGIYQDKLSEAVEVDKTTTVKALKKLIESGYVRRERL